MKSPFLREFNSIQYFDKLSEIIDRDYKSASELLTNHEVYTVIAELYDNLVLTELRWEKLDREYEEWCKANPGKNWEDMETA